jgi:hypothetical protein
LIDSGSNSQGENIMTLNPTETARLGVLNAKPVPQQTQPEKNELAALVAKQNR